MVLNNGDTLLIVHRRLFAEDVPRFFVGRVDGFDEGLVLVTGYSWVRDQVTGLVVTNEQERTKVVSLTAGTMIVYRLPTSMAFESFRVESDGSGRVELKDGAGFSMDLTESVHHGPRTAGTF